MLPLWMKETTGQQQKIVKCHFYFDMSFFSDFKEVQAELINGEITVGHFLEKNR